MLTMTNLFTECFFQRTSHRYDLHSFPTRRSSDLLGETFSEHFLHAIAHAAGPKAHFDVGQVLLEQVEHTGRVGRSEEHTSELQSHVNLVCRLLLEKKKNSVTTRRRSPRY